MKYEKTVFDVSTYKGTLFACGKSYGEENYEAINIGLDRDIKLSRTEWKYVENCMQVKWKYKKQAEELIAGIAKGSGRDFLEMARLNFERFGSSHNCTAVGATGPGAKDGNPILGMDWDGPISLYPWARMVRIDSKEWPRILCYASRPGQIPSIGMNELGMSVVWTTAAPAIRHRANKPAIGIPVGSLVAGILACRDCSEAVQLLKDTPNADGFIFFLSDAKGEVWVVEGIPSRLSFTRCKSSIGRANHLEDPELIKISRQILPPSSPKNNNRARGERIHELVEKYDGKIDKPVMEKMLRDTAGKPGETICRWRNGDNCMTIDSFILLPKERRLWTARGLPTRHAFECLMV